MLPKVISFFWESQKLSWLRYLTVFSFRKYNPDWKINIYFSSNSSYEKYWKSLEQQDFISYQGKDYLDKLLELDVNIKEYSLPFNIKITPSQKSNFFKWNLLATTGGFYSDFDILYVNSLDNLYQKVKDFDGGITFYNNYFSIGFMFSSGKSPMFEDIYKNCSKNFKIISYQGAGVEILKLMKLDWSTISKKYSNIYNIPFHYFYEYNSTMVNKIYEENSNYILNKDAIGLHWYAGHPKSQEMNNKLNETNYKNFNSLITRTIEKILCGT